MGKVSRVLPSGNLSVQYKDLPLGQVFVTVKAEDVKGIQYGPGRQIRCVVVSVEEVEDGVWEVSCKRAPKRRKK